MFDNAKAFKNYRDRMIELDIIGKHKDDIDNFFSNLIIENNSFDKNQ